MFRVQTDSIYTFRYNDSERNDFIMVAIFLNLFEHLSEIHISKKAMSAQIWKVYNNTKFWRCNIVTKILLLDTYSTFNKEQLELPLSWSVFSFYYLMFQNWCVNIHSEERVWKMILFYEMTINHYKVSQLWRKSNLICNSSSLSFFPTFIQIHLKKLPRKVRKTVFEQRAITHEKVGQSWRKSNLICNSSYGSLLPIFIQIYESIIEKSPENKFWTKDNNSWKSRSTTTTWCESLHMEACYRFSFTYMWKYSRKKSGNEFWTKGSNSWKSKSIVTKVKLDQLLFIWKLATNFYQDLLQHSDEKSGKRVWRTDRRSHRQTDRVQTYSPLRLHRWGLII